VNLAGHRVVAAPPAALQALFARDPAYFERVEGAPLRADEGAALLVERPPSVPLEHKHVVIVDDLVVLDLLEGFPEPTIWYLGLIFVAPEARGRGLGTRVLEALATALRARGARGLRLAVAVTNPDARRLYDRLGFAFVARRPRTGWNGAVVEVDVLERALAEPTA